MALKLVKDGEIESAPEIIETLRGGIADAEANKLFSIDSLITCTTAEEVARMCKLQILGLA